MICMGSKDIFKFIYWEVMPVAIGFIMFLYIDKMEISIVDKIIVFIVIALPVAIIRSYVGMKIFKEEPTLAEKIMSCGLRRKYGNGYCAECPDSYECAGGTDKKVGT